MQSNNARMTIKELWTDDEEDYDEEDHRDEFVTEKEYTNDWQFGKDLKEREKEFPWEFDSPVDKNKFVIEEEEEEEDNNDWYRPSRDSAIARDSDGAPIPYKNATNDDLPDLNVFIKTLLLEGLNKQLHSNHALTMEDFLELEKYSYKTQLSLFDSVKYSQHCHSCGDEMVENRFKEIYCCDNCEIAVEVYERNCIYTNLYKDMDKNESENYCKICSRKGNFAFNMRYGVNLTEIRIQNVRKFAQEHRIKMSDAITRYSELNDCGKECKLCYSSNV
jgi:hypothetical protein